MSDDSYYLGTGRTGECHQCQQDGGDGTAQVINLRNKITWTHLYCWRPIKNNSWAKCGKCQRSIDSRNGRTEDEDLIFIRTETQSLYLCLGCADSGELPFEVKVIDPKKRKRRKCAVEDSPFKTIYRGYPNDR